MRILCEIIMFCFSAQCCSNNKLRIKLGNFMSALVWKPDTLWDGSSASPCNSNEYSSLRGKS
jgi:hypothetical protein